MYAAIFGVALIASTVNASAGFGHGLISAPVFRLLEPDLLPVPIVLVGLSLAIFVSGRNSQLKDLKQVTPAIFGRIAGAVIAAVLLATLSPRGLSITIGVIVLTFAILRLSEVKVALSKPNLAGAGVASGIGGTIAALGGAPMALLYVQHSEARDFRGPISIYALVGSSISLGVLFLAGEFTGRAITLFGLLIPPMVLGMIASRWVGPVIDRGLLRPLVLGLSCISAVVLILTELL